MAVRARRASTSEMSIGGHLGELRKRFFIAAIGLILGMVAGFILARPAIGLISEPIAALTDSGMAALNFDTVTGGFDLTMKIAVTLGVVVSSPVWLWQIWAFLVPGMKRSETLYSLGFFAAAVPLFLAGCFSGWLVFPNIVSLMAAFTPEGGTNLFQAGYYYDFVLKLVVAVGVAFILPVFIVLLNFCGVLSARSIIGGWRVAVLVIMLFCAFATPAADVVSLFLLAVPMVALYFTAYGVAYLHDRRAGKRLAAVLADDAQLVKEA